MSAAIPALWNESVSVTRTTTALAWRTKAIGSGHCLPGFPGAERCGSRYDAVLPRGNEVLNSNARIQVASTRETRGRGVCENRERAFYPERSAVADGFAAAVGEDAQSRRPLLFLISSATFVNNRSFIEARSV